MGKHHHLCQVKMGPESDLKEWAAFAHGNYTVDLDPRALCTKDRFPSSLHYLNDVQMMMHRCKQTKPSNAGEG